MRTFWRGVGGAPGFVILSALAHAQGFDWRNAGVLVGVKIGQDIGGGIYDRVTRAKRLSN